jgi:hypothetical protein
LIGQMFTDRTTSRLSYLLISVEIGQISPNFIYKSTPKNRTQNPLLSGPPTLNDIHQILTWLGWSRAQTYGMVACMTPSVEGGATQTHFARTAYTEAPTQEYTHKPTKDKQTHSAEGLRVAPALAHGDTPLWSLVFSASGGGEGR